MRLLIAITGLLVAAALLCVSVLMNFRFGLTLGRGDLDRMAYATASIAGDFMKILAPFWISLAWRERRWIGVVIASMLFAVTFSWSVLSGLGFAAQNRAATTGERAAEITSYADMRSERDRLLKRLEGAAPPPPPEAVEARLAAEQGMRRWKSTSGCTDVTAPKSERFCEDYRRIEGELAEARFYARTERRLTELDARIRSATTGTAVKGDADPQVSLLLDILPVLSASSAELAVAVSAMILVELGATFGFQMAVAHLRPATDGPRITQTRGQGFLPPPDDHVEQWGLERLQIDEGAVLTLDWATADYRRWCAQRGYAGDERALKPALEKLGLKFERRVPPDRSGRGRVWLVRGISGKPV